MSDDPGPLGPDWTRTYHGGGTWSTDINAQMQPWSPEVSLRLADFVPGHKAKLYVFGRSEPHLPTEERFGAIVTPDTVCTRCGRGFGKGHVVVIEMRPRMAGTSRHRDCDDPTLGREVDDDRDAT